MTHLQDKGDEGLIAEIERVLACEAIVGNCGCPPKTMPAPCVHDHQYEDAKRSAMRLLERALTALKAQGWQPISTAPRDGTQVLLCRKGRKIWMCDGFWDVECWAWPYLKLEPTHWMPLPHPPKEPNNKEEA